MEVLVDEKPKNLPSPAAWQPQQHSEVELHTVHFLRRKVRLQKIPTNKEWRLPKEEQLS